ncbi:HD-GYP domain-containing protein [Inediibacterium massiliense]|uniref:HD-GYP domain-containing protein n=1 Tax=Inediibacterium massiliense TaxID=1658111 RepID=UPI0006B69702|nr:HD domain-containing phosphohydrolase [Inediibacterium massiliense]
METPIIQTINIPIENLKENMIIGEDVINDDGKKLVNQGYCIKDLERVISLFQNYGIDFVNIQIQEDSSIHDDDFIIPDIKNMDVENKREEEIIDFKENFHQTKRCIYTDFNDLLCKKPMTRETLKEHTKKHLKIFSIGTNIFQLIEMMRKMDTTIYTHCYHVALTSYCIGKWLNLVEEDLEELFLAAIFSDIGKLKLPKAILYKTEPLNALEKKKIQEHVFHSYHILEPYLSISSRIKKAILSHHEAINGKGYPIGIQDEEIPLFSKIIAVADTYNTLTSKNLSSATVLDTIKTMETDYKNQLDTKILYVFLQRIGDCFIGQKVKLKNQEIGEIVFMNHRFIQKPMIKLLSNQKIIDLSSAPKPFYIQELVV